MYFQMFGFRALFKLMYCKNLSLSSLYDTTWSDTTKKMKNFFLNNKMEDCQNLQVAVCPILTTIYQTPGWIQPEACQLPSSSPLGFPLPQRGGGYLDVGQP